MKTPELPNENPSAPDKRDINGQGQLFEAHLLNPTWPNQGTLDSIALEVLLSGQQITHPDFQRMTQSWRLAACVDRLVKKHGWPVEGEEVVSPTSRRPKRQIKRYGMRKDAIEMVKGGTP
jgi:hypothetical protein